MSNLKLTSEDPFEITEADFLPITEKMFMHVVTGEVDSLDNWMDCITKEEVYLENMRNIRDVMMSYIERGLFAEVKKESGEWVEV